MADGSWWQRRSWQDNASETKLEIQNGRINKEWQNHGVRILSGKKQKVQKVGVLLVVKIQKLGQSGVGRENSKKVKLG